MDVMVRPALGGVVAADTFADLTAAPVVGMRWESGGWLRVTFGADLTAAQVTAVQRRAMSLTTDEERLRAEVAGFLDLRNPTPKQVAAQVALLTRLALSPFDSTTGETP